MPRLFAGLEIPEAQRERLRRLRGDLAGARWVEPDNFHLTLRFFGDVDGPTADAIVDHLADIEAAPVTLQLSGLGVFGHRKPRAVWARATPSPELTALHQASERAARRAGLEPERRKFKAHVTLARLKSGKPRAVAAYLEAVADFETAPFPVERLALFSARPGRGGAPYVVEQTFALAGANSKNSETAGS